MKKNLVLMTVLFAGSMIVNDGFGARGSKYRYHSQSSSVVVPPVVERPNNETQRDVEEQDEGFPAEKEQQNEKEQIENLKKQLDTTKKELEEKAKELESAQNKKKELETKVNELKESQETIQAQLSEKEKELTKLNQDLQKTKKQKEEQDNILQNTQSELHIKEEELKKVENEFQKLNQKYEELQKQLRELQKSYEDLERKKETLDVLDAENIAKENAYMNKFSQLDHSVQYHILPSPNEEPILQTEATIEEKDDDIPQASIAIHQNQKSYWVPGWVKTLGTAVVVPALLRHGYTIYQNYSKTVPATPGTNHVCRYLCGTNHSVTHDVIWNTDTGFMRYSNGTEYKFGEYDLEQLNATYPEEFKQYFSGSQDESKSSARSKDTSWSLRWKTYNKPNKDELCKNYYEDGKKSGTETTGRELKKLTKQYDTLNKTATSLQNELETTKNAKKAAEQATEAVKNDLEKCKEKAISFATSFSDATSEKKIAEENLKQCNADKTNMYTKEEYDAHYNDGIKEGKAEKKCPKQTGSTISEEDQEIIRRYKERGEKVKQLQEKLRATSDFNVLKSFILIGKIIKVRFFDL